jgi:hypothetical protein
LQEKRDRECPALPASTAQNLHGKEGSTVRSAAKLHLFQSAPNGIGILLGHLWNRVPVTQLYDDANSPEGYFPTFLLAS